jgi:hypothetical protein
VVEVVAQLVILEVEKMLDHFIQEQMFMQEVALEVLPAL